MAKLQSKRYFSQLTIGAKTNTPTAKAATVITNATRLKSLPRISNARLGVTLVPNTSMPYANTKLVLSSNAGVVMTFRTPKTSRLCVMVILGSKAITGSYLASPSSISPAVGSRPIGRRGSSIWRLMARMEFVEGRVQRS